MAHAAVFLGLAALGGITIVAMRMGGQPRPPLWLALVHGIVAATGVVILAYTAATVGVPQMAQIALGIFVLAALGGLFVFITYHLKEQPLPVPLILGHGLIAIVGYVLLVINLIQKRGP